ncbi:MAG TPA: tRNA pseudouridine(38-40) synthase TruA [Anaerolineales bacterium]|nr:tRNA pseudouridine(38-40) synthase TruA [Anaerolineales bacterium]
MARYQVNLVYDGTLFFGFQRQAKQRTVQSAVEDALHQLGWQGVSLLAAGRTDTGVHASGQVIAFDLDWNHSEQALLNALNACLPSDVAARQVTTAEDDFHPRYAARARWYRYRLYLSAVRDPLRDRFAWQVWPVPDQSRLDILANLLVGRHDFGAFGTPPKAGRSTQRQIFRASWQGNGDELCFDVTGNAFLYRMVRRLVGLQVRTAQNRLPMEVISSYLERPDASRVQELAPPQGLTLMKVYYSLEEML